MLDRCVTRIYFPTRTTGDPVLASVPEARRATLLVAGDDGRFDIHLQGERETVFFEL